MGDYVNIDNLKGITASIDGELICLNDTTLAVGDIATIDGDISYDYDNIFKEIAKRFNQTPIVEHKCHNCGGVLEIKANDGIFKCPYCHSCYAIGTTRINEV